MAIDPTIYRRSYEAAAGPAIDPMAMRRQQVVEETAAAERDYRAAQLQGEQAKLDAANRKDALRGQIGGLAANNDGAGARRLALENGEFDIIDKLDSMDDSQRKRTLEVTRSIAPVIASLKQLPPAMRMQAASSVLVDRGLTPEQIAGLDLSDAGIDAKIGEAMTITEYFAQQKDNRDFDYRAGKDNRDFNYRAGNDAAGRAVQLRGQNMTDARARQANAMAGGNALSQAGQVVETPNGPMLVDKRTGQARPITMGGAPVQGIEQQKRVQSANRSIELLDDAIALIPVSTGSRVGAAADSIQGFFGGSNAGANAIAELDTISGALIANMPRMEGPQSDADRLLYQKAAGQLADPTIPAERRLAAVKQVRKLQERYAGGSVAPRPSPNAKPKPKVGGSTRAGGWGKMSVND